METHCAERILTIREATVLDLPRIVEMGREFLLSGPYKDHLKDSPEEAAKTAARIYENPSCKILVADDGERAVGIFAYVLFPHYFSGELTAGELIWFLEPEYRKSWTALQLWMEAEKRAMEAGAIYMQVTAPSEHVAEIYKRRKYEAVEMTYQKKLGGVLRQ